MGHKRPVRLLTNILGTGQVNQMSGAAVLLYLLPRLIFVDLLVLFKLGRQYSFTARGRVQNTWTVGSSCYTQIQVTHLQGLRPMVTFLRFQSPGAMAVASDKEYGQP